MEIGLLTHQLIGKRKFIYPITPQNSNCVSYFYIYYQLIFKKKGDGMEEKHHQGYTHCFIQQ